MSNYKVGFKKPPKHSRFKKGKSGNPRGRPKYTPNFKTEVLEALNVRVRVTEGGVPRKVPAARAALMLLIDRALKGDSKALKEVITLARNYREIPDDQPIVDLRLLTDEELRVVEKASRILESYASASPHSKSR